MHTARTAEDAAHPDHVARTQVPHSGRLIEHAPHRCGDRPAFLTGRQEACHVCLAHGERAERQAPPALHRTPRKRDNLSAAAANVDHDAVCMRDVLRRADEVVHRLLIAGDDADLHPRAPRDLPHGRAAVDCTAQGRRRKGMDVRDAERVDEACESAQDLHRLFDPRAHEAAVLEIAREADGVLALHEQGELSALDLVDRHADGVRADVDDRVQHGAIASARCRARG